MRDPMRQERFGNSFSVEYSDIPSFNIPPQRVVMYQKMGAHDVVHITYPRFSKVFTKAMATGAPVKIVWRNDKVKGEFVGYVSKVNVPTMQKIERTTTVICIGATFFLKERANKVWLNKTATDIATEVAKKYNLKPDVTPHPARFSQQSLSGQSYWEKLNELAYKIGYAVKSDGVQLHFHPIDKMIDMFATSPAVLSFTDFLSSPAFAYEAPTLDYFDAGMTDHDETLTQARTEKKVSGINPITGKTYTVTSSPNKIGKALRTSTKDAIFSTVETETVSESHGMARYRAEGHAQHSRLGVKAMGTAQGDPRISPYRTVLVDGTGEETDGSWVITEATHHLHRDGRYQVEFSCRVDGYKNNKLSATRTYTANNAPTRNFLVSSPRPESKLKATTFLVDPTKQGAKITPRRWIA